MDAFGGGHGAGILFAIAWLAITNAVTIVRFGQDKAYARAGQRRVPEATLLWLAAVGGTPGAFLARRMFRHKTRKQPFSDRLVLIAVVQAGVVVVSVWPL